MKAAGCPGVREVQALVGEFDEVVAVHRQANVWFGSGGLFDVDELAVVKPGRVLFELSFPNEEIAKAALAKAIQKLPITARIITREETF